MSYSEEILKFPAALLRFFIERWSLGMDAKLLYQNLNILRAEVDNRVGWLRYVNNPGTLSTYVHLKILKLGPFSYKTKNESF